jgi:hypothetical protein
MNSPTGNGENHRKSFCKETLYNCHCEEQRNTTYKVVDYNYRAAVLYEINYCDVAICWEICEDLIQCEPKHEGII